ncbi:Tripartite-type tricarboxylate transporter, receptor component TctC [Noviherbaspirillum humi]|uniref:Tripartite-type tricarboxylate transporter, receptor component TctC n=1 Tax=Noviherbaspirillum humi TaxID=1688639 RepID=A0A239L047_9BURK|nr:tripartite tricarboxylate transporter substrate binding protein [Noviherbaspirillum humi]SNT23831.1 Tripartite-type tricarboxylate transporter, receptor component TctC [Noviherbaspirillum humi]
MRRHHRAQAAEPSHGITRRLALRTIAAAAGLAAFGQAGPALAQQTYPNRPITIIVPFSPATGADILARSLGQRLSQKLNTPVMIDNRVGASGNIGAEAVARAAPDGYTLLVTATTFITNSALNKNLRFDPVKNFVPVSLLATANMGFVVRHDFPAKTIKELVASTKAKPGSVTYASSGVGTPQHLAMELFKLNTGADLVHVPFKASANATNDLAGGHVDAMIAPVHTLTPFLQSGRMRMLAVMSENRSPVFKNIPTMAEEGLPNLEVDVWYGMLAPAGTPPAIINKLNSEIDGFLATADIKETLSHQGLVTAGGPPERFAKLIRMELERWPRVVAQAGIKPE